MATAKLRARLVALIPLVIAGCSGGTKVTPPGGVQGTATLQPSYYVLSLEYAPPGNESGNGYYALATTDGAIAGFTPTFVGNPTLDYNSDDGIEGAAVDLGPSFSFASVPGLMETFQDAYTNLAAMGSKFSTAGDVTSTTDSVDHAQDVFFLWLNPQVIVSQTGTNSATFTIGTPNQQGGQSQPMDIIDVSVEELLNPSLIPASKLGPQTVNGVSGLPGLNSLCAQSAACTADDFADILKLDALVSVASTEPPSNVDPIRFVYVGPAQLYGPECASCEQIINTYWDSDSTVPPNSGETLPYTVTLTASMQTSGSFTLPLAQNDRFTWNYLTSVGGATGLHESQVSLESSVVGCFEEVAIFEDTLFHTFLFEDSTVNSC